MLGIATTVLTSLGHERTSALVTLAAVIAVAGACAVVVPGAGFGQPQLVRSAEATGGALAATLVVAGWIVRRRAGAFVPAATALRAGLGLAACVALGFVLPRVGRFVTPAMALLVAVAYVAVLALTRELSGADLAMARAIARPKA
jgi:stage V sporulation protein B